MKGHILFTPLKILVSVLMVLTAIAERPCELRAICYALDQSGSISDSSYTKLQAFTESSARAFKLLASSNVRTEYSAVAFSSTTKPIIQGTENLEGTFIPTINSDRIFRGGTDIHKGIDACFSILQNAGAGPRVLVLVTDGQSGSQNDNTKAIKKAGVAIVTVGVGRGINKPFLRNIATNPSFYIDATFSTLPKLSSSVAKTACEAAEIANENIEPSQTEPQLPNSCEAAFDRCDFTFANRTTLSTFNVSSTPDISFTDRITFKNNQTRVGVINTGAFVPELIDALGKAESITAFAQTRYGPSAFNTYCITNSPSSGTGIGHPTFLDSQLIGSTEKCVLVHFQAYQIVSPNGNVLSNVIFQKPTMGACVVFRTGSYIQTPNGAYNSFS